MLLLLITLPYVTCAYVPEKLQECLSIICEISDVHEQSASLQEIYCQIQKNGPTIASESLVQAIRDGLLLLEKYKDKHADLLDSSAMIDYLNNYLDAFELKLLP